jgi:hypothetical protein
MEFPEPSVAKQKIDGFTVWPALPPESTRVPVVEKGKDPVFP